jgi:hypothetical protein
MKSIATRTTLGFLIVAASLAAAGSASAQSESRWYNADTSQGTFYLGVYGGGQCDHPRHCWVTHGTQLVTWSYSGLDQEWYATTPGTGTVTNWYPNNIGQQMCMGVDGGSTAERAALKIWECVGHPDQNWKIKKAEDYGAPFPGCFVFINQNSGQVMSVSLPVGQGSHVVQFPFFQGVWHPDQFWCPSS